MVRNVLVIHNIIQCDKQEAAVLKLRFQVWTTCFISKCIFMSLNPCEKEVNFIVLCVHL